jgi:Bacterial Ig-like domain (group 3)
MTSLRIRSFGLIAFVAASLAGPLVATAQAAAPTTRTTPLAITGGAVQNDTLSANGEAGSPPGTWDNTPTTIADQWYDCPTNAISASCTAVSGTATSYQLSTTSDPVGDYVYLQETASNTDGTAVANSNLIGPVQGPPTRGAITITGAATQGTTVTSDAGAASWTNSPTTADQWYDCPTNKVSTACNPVVGTGTAGSATSGTGTTYTIQAADVNQYLYLNETASNAAGTGTANSNVIGPVVAVPVSDPTNPPSISGSTVTGQTLTANVGTWSNAPTSYTYQWMQCAAGTCSSVGTGVNTYPLTSADQGDTIEVTVTAMNTAGSSAAVTSAAVGPVVPPAPTYSAAPGINGTTQSGETLTEKAGSWPGYTGQLSIQWYRCAATCTAVAGATGSTYLLTDTDVGAQMQVTETATNAGGSTTAPSSLSDPIKDKTGVVAPPAAAPGSVPTIGGTLQLGRTLTATSAGFINNPSAFGNQWLRCNALGCSAIPGANDLTYTPSSADVGDSIAFSETASNSGGTSNPVQSGRTGTITAPSTTTLQASSGSPAAGQTVTLIATVTSAAGSVKPAGTVDFHDGNTAIAGCTGLALGSGAPTAVCQTSFSASVANVTAAYSATPGTFITGSTSSATALLVGRAATTVTVATSGHATLGAKTTYTATVNAPAGDVLTPTGRITFTDGGKSIKGCGSTALAARHAPCSVKYLGITQHRIAAHYDGDANFAPSASITSHVLVQPKAPSGFVAVFMNWTFGYTPHSTRIKSLTASGLSKGIHVTVTCSGGGCPFAHRTLARPASGKCGKGKTVKRGCLPASSVNLAPIFHEAHLRVGTKVTLAVTHPNWVGKYYRFTIRSSHLPKILVSCLAVNGTRPGVGCSAQ